MLCFDCGSDFVPIFGVFRKPMESSIREKICIDFKIFAPKNSQKTKLKPETKSISRILKLHSKLRPFSEKLKIQMNLTVTKESASLVCSSNYFECQILG